jgi:hypothetical protein
MVVGHHHRSNKSRSGGEFWRDFMIPVIVAFSFGALLWLSSNYY